MSIEECTRIKPVLQRWMESLTGVRHMPQSVEVKDMLY